MKCDICGKEWTAQYKQFSELFTPVYDDNHLFLKVKNGSKQLHESYDICSECANAIHVFIAYLGDSHMTEMYETYLNFMKGEDVGVY